MGKRLPPEPSASSPSLNLPISKRPHPRQLSTLQKRLQKRLDSGQFRMLNESMYTSTGTESRKLMRDNPTLFQLYHTGYAEQVKRWPKNPLDAIIAFFKTKSNDLRIADLGCGEGRLAKEVPQKEVKSFDFVAMNDGVIECDIANVPLGDSTVDVGVFCLSLMGTNYGEYIAEARRIVIPGGLVLVAEVASRFEDQNPGAFVKGVEQVGFKEVKGHALDQARVGLGSGNGKKRKAGGLRKKKKRKDGEVEEVVQSSDFFFSFAFRSTKKEVVDGGGKENRNGLPSLAACVYKKR